MTSIRFEHCQPDLLLEMVEGDHEVFLQLADIFMRDSLDGVEQLRAASVALDFGQMARQSHALKGTVGPLGVDALVQMLVYIEEESSRQHFVCDEKILGELHVELDHVRRELRQYIAQF